MNDIVSVGSSFFPSHPSTVIGIFTFYLSIYYLLVMQLELNLP